MLLPGEGEDEARAVGWMGIEVRKGRKCSAWGRGGLNCGWAVGDGAALQEITKMATLCCAGTDVVARITQLL